MKRNQNGFGAIEALLVIVIVGAVAAIGWYVFHSLQNTNNAYSAATKTSSGPSPKFTPKPVGKGLATLSGTVTEGPTSPVEQTGDTGASLVANHIVQAQNAQGKITASTKTDSQGKYTLHVPPGQYTIVLVPQIGPGAPANDSVTVAPGVNTFNLTVDTGIR